MPTNTEPHDPAFDERKRHRVPYTAVHDVVRRLMESSQDILVVGLALALFGTMVRIIFHMCSELVGAQPSFRLMIGETLFVLVLLELQRLLILYLRDHHVSVDVTIEAALVSILREVILVGAVEIDWRQLVAITVFVLALGALLRFGDIRASQRRIYAQGRTSTQLAPPAAPTHAAEEPPSLSSRPPSPS